MLRTYLFLDDDYAGGFQQMMQLAHNMQEAHITKGQQVNALLVSSSQNHVYGFLRFFTVGNNFFFHVLAFLLVIVEVNLSIVIVDG